MVEPKIGGFLKILWKIPAKKQTKHSFLSKKNQTKTKLKRQKNVCHQKRCQTLTMKISELKNDWSLKTQKKLFTQKMLSNFESFLGVKKSKENFEYLWITLKQFLNDIFFEHHKKIEKQKN